MEYKIIEGLLSILCIVGMFLIKLIFKWHKDLDERLHQALTKEEVHNLIDDKLIPLNIKTQYISDNVLEVKKDLDVILTKYFMK